MTTFETAIDDRLIDRLASESASRLSQLTRSAEPVRRVSTERERSLIHLVSHARRSALALQSHFRVEFADANQSYTFAV